MAKEKSKEQLEAEQAAQQAAEQAAQQEEQRKKDEAAAELKKKVDAAIAEASTGFDAANTALVAAENAVATLHEGSVLDEVKAVETIVTDALKAGKAALKDVKAAARKVKDNDDLKQAVTSTEGLVERINGALKDVKGRISAAREATKAAEKQKREADKAEKQRLAEEERQRKLQEREANKEPEQNGIRRPGAGTLCRAAWDMFDAVSTVLGSTAPIGYVLPVALDRGLNEANVKAEYARWKKYHGITGRVDIPVPAEVRDAANAVEIPVGNAVM